MIIAILPLLIWRRREAWIDVRNAGGALFASAIGLAGSMVAFILALGLAPVANVLIVFGATPFITALAARLVLGEPLHRHTLFAMAAATVRSRDVGCGLAGGRRARRHGGRLHRRALHERQLRGRSPSPPCRHDAGAGAGRRDLGPDLAPFANPSTAGAAELPWLLALGPGQLAGGLLLYMAALKRIPAGRAALLGLLELVLGPIWVWADRRREARRPDLAGRRRS